MQRSGINASFCNTISVRVYYSYPIHAQTNERLLQSKNAIMELTCHDTDVSVKYRDHEVNVSNFLLYNNNTVILYTLTSCGVKGHWNHSCP